MIYWKLKFHGGPWDGEELEISHEPHRIELCVGVKNRPAHLPHASEMWAYEVGKKEGEVCHMDGKKLGGPL